MSVTNCGVSVASAGPPTGGPHAGSGPSGGGPGGPSGPGDPSGLSGQGDLEALQVETFIHLFLQVGPLETQGVGVYLLVEAVCLRVGVFPLVLCEGRPGIPAGGYHPFSMVPAQVCYSIASIRAAQVVG